MNRFFKVSHKSNKSKARLGEITTSHGVIRTPAFAPCATKGTIKTLLPQLVREIEIQTAFVNTYHLSTHPGVDIIEKAGGIHEFSRLNIPLMSDSGGFQVFSLARNEKARYRKFFDGKQKTAKNLVSSLLRQADVRGEEQPMLVKISEDGVQFRSTYDGKLIEFTPEKSMEFQRKIGADINMAFDECTYYPSSHKYAEQAMIRTHKWLVRCIKYKESSIPKFLPIEKARHRVSRPPHPKGTQAIDSKQVSSLSPRQYLYGVIQGATFEDLRKKSAEFVVFQDTPGVAIGGVSVGETKKEMRDQVRWVSDFLPKDRPVHLLGVGQVDDIIDLVKYGIDTFDCVEPTRLARMGRIYQSSLSGQTDILKSIYKADLSPVDEDCNCYVCKNFTKSYLHHLFKQREILGYTLATYHNLWTMERLFEKIRELIVENKI